MNNKGLPLVSVIVLTYNSGNYVVETLESIKEQSYENIELIITDDCSTDDTINICNHWLSQNGKRFSRAKLLTVVNNTGIPTNCNRGLLAAEGDWIKFIAGDDKLKQTAITEVINFINSNETVEVLDSVVDIYNGDFTSKIGQYNFASKDFYNIKISASDQRKMFAQALFRVRVISTLGVFIRRQLIHEVGGFDERYRLLEDSPLWWNVLKAGKKFHFLDKPTICYRRHEKAVSFNGKINFKERIISDFQITVFSFIREALYKETSLLNKINFIWLDFFYRLIIKIGNKGTVAEYFYKIAHLFQPIRLFSIRTK